MVATVTTPLLLPLHATVLPPLLAASKLIENRETLKIFSSKLSGALPYMGEPGIWKIQRNYCQFFHTLPFPENKGAEGRNDG